MWSKAQMGAVENELKKKKSQWYAMFDAVMYRCIPVVRVAYISLFFNFPKSGQSINKYMT